jgi:signal peptidase II
MWLVVVLALIAMDQLSKAFFAETIPLGEAIPVTSWFNFVHWRNTGAAFSFLADAGGWQRWFFVAIGVLVVAPIAAMCLLRTTPASERWFGAGIVAGGGSNLWDRVQSGAVVDFLDFHWRALHWPAFNLADVYIVCAAVAWVGYSTWESRRIPTLNKEAA